MALVPFADLFNHKAALVKLAGGYFVEDVCFEGEDSPSDQGSEDFDDPGDDSDNPGGSGDPGEGSAMEGSEEEEELENVVQPMTLGGERGGSTRGAMLDPCTQQDPKFRMEIGICGVTNPDGTEVLEVSHVHARVHSLGSNAASPMFATLPRFSWNV